MDFLTSFLFNVSWTFHKWCLNAPLSNCDWKQLCVIHPQLSFSELRTFKSWQMKRIPSMSAQFFVSICSFVISFVMPKTAVRYAPPQVNYPSIKRTLLWQIRQHISTPHQKNCIRRESVYLYHLHCLYIVVSSASPYQPVVRTQGFFVKIPTWSYPMLAMF